MILPPAGALCTLVACGLCVLSALDVVASEAQAEAAATEQGIAAVCRGELIAVPLTAWVTAESLVSTYCSWKDDNVCTLGSSRQSAERQVWKQTCFLPACKLHTSQFPH